jgi:hypothetical protein
MYNLNIGGARTLLINTLESGTFAGKPLNPEYAHQDKIHLDILKNWRKKSLSERNSFIDDIMIENTPEEKDFALSLVSETHLEIKDKISTKKDSFKKLFGGSKK